MAKIESLNKKIEKIADKVKYLRTILLTLVSSLVGILFGISQNKIIINTTVQFFLLIGGIFMTILVILIAKLEFNRDMLINEIERI